MEINIATCFFQQESLDPPKKEWFNSVFRTDLSVGSPGVCLEIPAGLIPIAKHTHRWKPTFTGGVTPRFG